MSVQPWFAKQEDCFPEAVLFFPTWQEHDADLWVPLALWGGEVLWGWHCFIWTVGTSRRLISGGWELAWEITWCLEAQSSTNPSQNEKPLGEHNLEENNFSYPSSCWKENIKCRYRSCFPLVSLHNKHGHNISWLFPSPCMEWATVADLSIWDGICNETASLRTLQEKELSLNNKMKSNTTETFPSMTFL